jgi:hypothetical protein
MWATFAIFKKLSRVNNPPLGENSPHLVTLRAGLPDGLFSNQKIPAWVYFGVPWCGKCWDILWLFKIFIDHLV